MEDLTKLTIDRTHDFSLSSSLSYELQDKIIDFRKIADA